MLDDKIDTEMLDNLYEIIANTRTKEETESLLNDLCSIREINQFAQRLKAAEMIMNGSTYNDIIKETRISSTTLSRVSKCVKNGKGYICLNLAKGKNEN